MEELPLRARENAVVCALGGFEVCVLGFGDLVWGFEARVLWV